MPVFLRDVPSKFLAVCWLAVCLSSASANIQFGDLVRHRNVSYTLEDLEAFVSKVQHKSFEPGALIPKHCKTGPPVSQEDEWLCSMQEKCHSPGFIVNQVLSETYRTVTVNESTVSYDAQDLQALCPTLLIQTLAGKCTRDHAAYEATRNKPSKFEVWWYGFLLVTAISASALAGAIFLPMISLRFYEGFMTVLIGLAVGSLAASALFHLLPQAFRIREYIDGVEHLYPALAAVLGIYGFLLMESCLKAVLEWKKRSYGGTSAVNLERSTQDTEFQYVPSEGRSSSSPSIDFTAQQVKSNTDTDQDQVMDSSRGRSTSCTGAELNVKDILRTHEQVIKASFGHPESRPERHSYAEKTVSCFRRLDTKRARTSIATVAWMIIVGDGFHKFIDGISVGAAFTESILVGLSVSIAVICEEFPHALGNLAVLLNSGMSFKQAMLYNFLTSIFCYLGLAVGIILGDFTQSATSIFGVAGGVFLYIALSDMVPEMNETSEKAAKAGFAAWFKVVVLQTLGFGIGMTTLFVLAFYQDDMDSAIMLEN